MSWSWVFTDGGPPSELQNPTHTFTSPGSHGVTLSVKNAEGVWVPSDMKIITVIPTSGHLETLRWEPKSMSLASGSSGSAGLYLESPRSGLETYEVTATIANSSVASFTGTGTAPYWTDLFEVRPIGPKPYRSVRIYGLSYVGMPADSTGKLPLGSLHLKGEQDGTTEIILSNPEFVYQSLPTPSTYRLKGEILPVTVASLQYPILPLPGMIGPQADTDGDGLIDDFNGDGYVNSFDIITFFDAYVAGYLDPYSLYDYNGNGRLDLNDIVAFYERWRLANARAMMLP
jgi:PKD repeat protein